jgi:hypothetical protein
MSLGSFTKVKFLCIDQNCYAVHTFPNFFFSSSLPTNMFGQWGRIKNQHEWKLHTWIVHWHFCMQFLRKKLIFSKREILGMEYDIFTLSFSETLILRQTTLVVTYDMYCRHSIICSTWGEECLGCNRTTDNA